MTLANGVANDVQNWDAPIKPSALTEVLEIGPVSVRGLALFEIAFGLITVVAIYAFLTRTRYGLVVRAGSEDSEMVEALGIDVRRVFTVIFALGIAGVAGTLLMWDPNWGASVPLATETLLPAFVVVIVGGFGTLAGPLYGRLFDESVKESLSTGGAGGGLLPYLRGYLPASVLETDLLGVTVGTVIETFLNGHASLYLGLLFVLFVLYVPSGLLGAVRKRLGGTVATWVAHRIERYR